jgi:hypothetical protein
MPDKKRYNPAGGMKLAGQIIGLVAGGFFFAFITGEAISDIIAKGWAAITAQGILLGILIVLALAGGILSWWREQAGGVLLLLAAIGLGILIGAFAGQNHFIAWLIIGLPFLIAGGLLLSAWWLERKAAR